MQFDKSTVSLFSIVQLIKRGNFKLTDEEKIEKEVDFSFIIENTLPVRPVFVADKTIIIGSNLIEGLGKYMDKQDGRYLRIVQDFPIQLYTVKEYEEEDLEKLILSWK